MNPTPGPRRQCPARVFPIAALPWPKADTFGAIHSLNGASSPRSTYPPRAVGRWSTGDWRPRIPISMTQGVKFVPKI